MNENINLCEILNDCPKGVELYSPLAGNVSLERIDENGKTNICVRDEANREWWFRCDGKYMRWLGECERWSEECMLLPSREQRDWSKFKAPVRRFDPKSFKPFDMVLVRQAENQQWVVDFFGFFNPEGDIWVSCTSSSEFNMCIPYNDETKHLLGTMEDCPKYYKWWEE